jgi:DNA-binding NtrC family response regulator
VKGRILVIEDDQLKRRTIADTLRAEDYEVKETGDGTEGARLLLAEEWDVAVVDVMLPGTDGLTILRTANKERPGTAVIVMTAFGSVPGAVEAMKAGAYDYLTKPFTNDELLMRIARCLEYRSQRTENRELRRVLDDEYRLHSLVGKSRRTLRLFEHICAVADSDATVLIVGETGTGKELVAETIHYNSPRRAGPLVKVSCVALRDTLIESELFGHEKGAFSGAIRTRPGRVELAAGGTLFLDDIDDVPTVIQPKLLRVLQNKEYERVGGERTLKADIRVVAATKQNLAELAAAGRFREDLYYRLNTVTVQLPPLRERRDEIPALVRHFIARYDRRGGRSFSDDALQLLQRHNWPGNIRELEHVVEATLVLTREQQIGPEHLAKDFLDKVALRTRSPGLREGLAAVEREAVEQALLRSGGSVSRAARELGIARSTLRDRMKALGLPKSPASDN